MFAPPSGTFPIDIFGDDVDVVRYPDLAGAVRLAAIACRRRYDRPSRRNRAQAPRQRRRFTIRSIIRRRRGSPRAAALAGIRHFILVSSLSAQNGCAADHALTERDPAAPADAQGRSKLAAEEAVRASGVPFTILRLAPVYGPGMRGGLAFLLRAAVSPLPLPVRDFTNRRSYLGIDNFVSALEFVVALPQASNEIYLVADPGIPPNMADLVTGDPACARAAARCCCRRRCNTPRRRCGLMRLGDIWDRYCGNLRVDCGKLIAAGWHPVYDTRTGIAKLTENSGRRLAARSRRLPHDQRLIDRGHDLRYGQVVETLAVAVEPPLAAFLLTGQTQQRILHEPDIAAALNGAGSRPRRDRARRAATVPTAADRSDHRAPPSARRWRRQDA